MDSDFKCRGISWSHFPFAFGLLFVGLLATFSRGEDPPKLLPSDPAWPHLLELTIDQQQGGDLQLQGPLPSFVKVWNADEPQQPLEFSFNQDATKLTVHLNNHKAEKLTFLQTEGTTACSDGKFIFSALDAKVVGKRAKLESHPGNHRIGFWNKPQDFVTWNAAVPAGNYKAELVYSRATLTGTKVTIAIGEKKFPLTLKKTGSWYRYRTIPLGDVAVADAEQTRVEVRCDKIINGGVMNLKAIVLTPKQTTKQTAAHELSAKQISFSRDIRPLLSDRCYLCHGPDEAGRQADLRLDGHEFATEWAIAPGDPDTSEVIARIISDDPEIRMPPPESNKAAFTPEEISTIKQWIAAGAHYEKHWAFESPQRPQAPMAQHSDWNSNPIDRFVLAQLDARGWEPAPRADRRTLLRRAAFDLTGLPPTLEQIREFLQDNSPGAWSRALDRLLASEAYGEHQARYWLDAARYADSNGYQYDFQRDQWAWRDWLINAYNANMPFDQFTIEQLAGDLLPNATPQQRLATGFNRNHPITVEGGIIDEEYRIEYVLDRTTTVGTVWLGMTLGCARCHDHKYDPLSQKEFYQLSAFFNQVPEKGMRGFNPAERIVSPFQVAEAKASEAELAATESDFLATYNELNPSLDLLAEYSKQDPTEAWKVVTPDSVKSQGGATMQVLNDQSVLATGHNPKQDTYEIILPAGNELIYAIQLLAMPDPEHHENRVGRSENGNFVLTEIEVFVSDPKNPQQDQPIEIASATASHAQGRHDISLAIDKIINARGWAILGKPGSVHEAHTAALFFPEPLDLDPNAKLKVRLRFESPFAHHQIGRFQLATAGWQVTDLAKSALAAWRKPEQQRSRKEQLSIAELMTIVEPASESQPAWQNLVQARKRRQQFLDTVPKTMIMQDVEKNRGAYVLDRGEYDKRREHVQADTPAFLPPMAAELPRNRLGFARWLTQPDHPLTSRVAVNRIWIQLFGIGLVDSPEDFGLQSQPPSHPELLDWLAAEYIESGWDTKQLFKTIMTSQTYQQSSAVTEETFARDPENRQLAHGPRLRLDAETIRDSALAVSGLLNRRLGGPSVFPYHPKGLWLEINNRPGYSSTYKQDSGEKLYRRSMYTYWKRTVTPPSMAVFDAPSREYCQVRRSRTNTPLQAFVMLHDPQFVEAARKLAGRMLQNGGSTLAEQIQFGFELCVGRLPTAAEQQVLVNTYEEQLKDFHAAPRKAEEVLSIGESPRNEQMPPAHHAAMTSVARLLMNLSEFITKG